MLEPKSNKSSYQYAYRRYAGSVSFCLYRRRQYFLRDASRLGTLTECVIFFPMFLTMDGEPPIDNQPTNSMELSPSLEVVSRSATQKFAKFVLEPGGLLPCSQEASTGPYTQPNTSHRWEG
jgi:hypothetical protein